MTTSTYPARIADNVRAAMRARGYSQRALATHLGCTQQALSRRLTGAVAFDVHELATIANALRVPLSKLTRDRGPR